MRKFVVIGLAIVVGSVVAGNAMSTPASGVTAETARGTPVGDMNVNTHYSNGGKVKLKTSGAIEVITQRIVATPGATFGWHSHPGENVNVILQGTLTLYHDEHCTEGTAYGAGSSFPTHPDEVHLARNLGTTDLVLYATYFAPKAASGASPTPVRVDQSLPAAGCPS